MILLFSLLLATSAQAENYVGKPGAEVVSDFELASISSKIELVWKGDAFTGVPGFANPHPKQEGETTLQATMPGDHNSMAVVNDQVVREGGKVNGKKVRKIGSNYVLLEEAGSVKEFNLDDKAVPAIANARKSGPTSGADNFLNEASKNRSPASTSSSEPEGTIKIEERLGK